MGINNRKNPLNKFKIVISNDDGVHAPGLVALSKALSQIADITIVAPDRDRSGAGNSLTLTRPLRIQTIPMEVDGAQVAISVDGTPTDCVHLAVSGLINVGPEPDIVVSGINSSANLGDDILYSGTVAAAIEGRFLGFPAIAISLAGENSKHYATAAIIACKLVQLLQHKQLPAATILNVNIPDLPLKEIQGYEITRLGTRHRAEPLIKGEDPRGQAIYWVGPPGLEDDAGIGTDFYAIKNNKVSITPLHVDLTSYESFDSLGSWISDLQA